MPYLESLRSISRIDLAVSKMQPTVPTFCPLNLCRDNTLSSDLEPY
jgi:hypothetical protein